jgi:hypothetical protein
VLQLLATVCGGDTEAALGLGSGSEFALLGVKSHSSFCGVGISEIDPAVTRAPLVLQREYEGNILLIFVIKKSLHKL